MIHHYRGGLNSIQLGVFILVKLASFPGSLVPGLTECIQSGEESDLVLCWESHMENFEPTGHPAETETYLPYSQVFKMSKLHPNFFGF